MKIEDRKHGLGIKTEMQHIEIKEKNIQSLNDKYAKKKIITITPKDKNITLNNKETHTNTQINIAKNTTSTITLNTEEEKTKDQIKTQYITVNIDDNCNITLVEIKKHSNTNSYSNKKIHIKKNSELKILTVETNAKLSINETYTKLDDNSVITSTNIYYGKENQQYEITNIAEHEGKNTQSLLQSKGVLDGGKAISKGMIIINENAENSNGYQQNDTLLLKESKAISIPELEIHNNQVKCTHGSTTTRIDEEKIFYMQSRGISEEQAKIEIVKGFYENSAKEFDEEIKNNLMTVLMDAMNK